VIKTTKAQFDVFKESVLFYLDLLHLGGYKAIIKHGKTSIPNSFAVIEVNRAGRIATFTMTDSVPDHCKDEIDPWLHGKHEACELLLWELSCGCQTVYAQSEVEMWTHDIIRKLEKVLPNK